MARGKKQQARDSDGEEQGKQGKGKGGNAKPAEQAPASPEAAGLSATQKRKAKRDQRKQTQQQQQKGATGARDPGPRDADSGGSGSEDEEKEEVEVEVKKPANKGKKNALAGFAALALEDEEEEEEEEQEEEEEKPEKVEEDVKEKRRKERKERGTREERKAAKSAAKASKLKAQQGRRRGGSDGGSDGGSGSGSDSDAGQDKPFGASGFRKSTAAAYSYASGQPLGPEGTNPADAIACTGNLLSPPNSRDLQIDKVSVQAFGKLLIKDSEVSLINGRRYGLIAPNGSGKSTLLHAIACGLMPVPDALDVYLLDREFMPTEMTSVEAVMDIIVRERHALEEEMGELFADPQRHAVRLDSIQMRLSELEANGAERRAEEILRGLGFTDALLARRTRDLSGGWRMRISLARILFVKPTLIMLDEPTNHLDLDAVVWLEEYLLHQLEGHTLIMTSHSQDTLNEVCTDIIHLHHQRLDYYSGNYDTFTKVRAEKDSLLAKRANKMDKEMTRLKHNLGKTGSVQQQQAKAAMKALTKRTEKEVEKDKTLQEEIVHTRDLEIKFADCGGGIPAPAIKFRDVRFAYAGKETLLDGLNFGLDLESRIALVGPNGAGKTTLLKLILGTLDPTEGSVTRHTGLRLAHFHQHMGDQLDLNMSAVDWLRREFGDLTELHMRALIGKYGLTQKSQVIPMRQLSDGQRRRVIFAYLGLKKPHVLCMDEPTNALDIETIDALGEAINNFDGGVILITHDFRLIDRVAEEVWIVDEGEVDPWAGDIKEYKQMLKDRIREEREAADAAAK